MGIDLEEGGKPRHKYEADEGKGNRREREYI